MRKFLVSDAFLQPFHSNHLQNKSAMSRCEWQTRGIHDHEQTIAKELSSIVRNGSLVPHFNLHELRILCSALNVMLARPSPCYNHGITTHNTKLTTAVYLKAAVFFVATCVQTVVETRIFCTLSWIACSLSGLQFSSCILLSLVYDFDESEVVGFTKETLFV